MTIDQILQYADRGGFIVGLVAFIVLLYTGKLRWGREYDEKDADLAECENTLKGVNDKTEAKLARLEQAAEVARGASR